METILNNLRTGYVNGWTIYKSIISLGEDAIKANNWLFFTEENSFLEAMRDPNNLSFYKPIISEELIDDKLAFHDFLLSIDEQPIPSYKIDEEFPNYPIYLKAKHSWRNGVKIPRGWLCYNAEELDLRIDQLHQDGWSKSLFFLQDFLDYPVQNNISVSGYFDYLKPERNLLIVTKKIVGSSKIISGGVIVETIIDPKNLIQRTSNILANIKFDGPFEMEYYLDESNGIYYVLELNSRFWMQHGIFLNFFDNGLIERYLNLDVDRDYSQSDLSYRHVAWIDTISAIILCLKGNFRPLVKYFELTLNRIPIYLAPDPITACKLIFKRFCNKIFKTKFSENLF